MKDKELRKLLKEKGIVETWDGVYTSCHLGDVGYGFERKDHSALRDEMNVMHLANRQLTEHLGFVHDHLIILEAKFNAINKHYGITVEHEDAKYTVKEIK